MTDPGTGSVHKGTGVTDQPIFQIPYFDLPMIGPFTDEEALDRAAQYDDDAEADARFERHLAECDD